MRYRKGIKSRNVRGNSCLHIWSNWMFDGIKFTATKIQVHKCGQTGSEILYFSIQLCRNEIKFVILFNL